MKAAFRVAAPFSEKARRAYDARKNWAAKLEAQLESAPSGKRLMLHAPSVGEFLQGRAVIDELKKNHPGLVVVVTYFSPSAENIARAYENAAARSILPLDSQSNASKLLDIVRPDILVFSRADVWPNIAGEAHHRGIGIALVAGTLPPNAGRLIPIAAPTASAGLKTLDLVAAISDDEVARFEKLGVDNARINVTGDPRFDQTWRRAKEVGNDDELFAHLPRDAQTLVAGSTWPPDEKVLIRAFAKVKNAVEQAKLIIAPHEPSPNRVSDIVKSLRGFGLEAITLSDAESGAESDPDAIVVDRVGVLAKLYRVGSAAFVGGSFVRRVHNVMEPACMGIPVIVGPKHANAREAQLLIKSGGGFCVKNVTEMQNKLLDLFSGADTRERAGRAAREFINANLGAAKRTAELIEKRFPQIFR